MPCGHEKNAFLLQKTCLSTEECNLTQSLGLNKTIFDKKKKKIIGKFPNSSISNTYLLGIHLPGAVML